MKLSERMIENMDHWIRIYPPVREWANEVTQLEEREARLLAVARAARTVVAHIELAREPNRPLGKSPIMSEALAEALAAVEDLL